MQRRGVTPGLRTNTGSYKATERTDSGVSLAVPVEQLQADILDADMFDITQGWGDSHVPGGSLFQAAV